MGRIGTSDVMQHLLGAHTRLEYRRLGAVVPLFPVIKIPSSCCAYLTLSVLSEENRAYGKINAGAGGQVPLCSACWLQRWSGEAVLLSPLKF